MIRRCPDHGHYASGDDGDPRCPLCPPGVSGRDANQPEGIDHADDPHEDVPGMLRPDAARRAPDVAGPPVSSARSVEVERDANQLAADAEVLERVVREHRGRADARPALARVLALVGTLQQERDEAQTGERTYLDLARHHKDKREAAETALAATRQALAQIAKRLDTPRHVAAELRALADTGGDTAYDPDATPFASPKIQDHEGGLFGVRTWQPDEDVS